MTKPDSALYADSNVTATTFVENAEKSKVECTRETKDQVDVLELEKDQAETSPGALEDYPDGGVRAWLVVLGSWCVGFATFGVVNAWGVFQNYYHKHQLSDKNESDIAWIGSLQLCFTFMGGMISGRLFDAGYLRHILAAGGLLILLCFFLTSICTQYWHFILCQGMGLGLGFGMIFIPGVSCISHFWRSRRGLALGIMMTGSSVGGIVFPIMFNELFYSSIGYAWSVRAAGLVEAILLFVAFFTLKSRHPPRKNGQLIHLSAFKDLEFALFFVGCFFVLLGLYVPIFYLETFAAKAKVSPTVVKYIIAIFNASSIFGRWIPNWYTDKIGPLNIHIPFTFISGILVFVWLATGTTEGTLAFAIVYGFTSGAWQSTVPACLAKITKRIDEIGARLGLLFAGNAISSLIGTPIAGAIISSQGGSYTGCAIYGGVTVMFGISLVAIARMFWVRRCGTPYV